MANEPDILADPATSPDIFTPEEAARYLKMPSVEAFNRNRRRYKLKGQRVGQRWLYAREHLEALRRHIFGIKR